MKMCVSKKCKNKEVCKKHFINNEILKGKTYSDKDFISNCDKEK